MTEDCPKLTSCRPYSHDEFVCRSGGKRKFAACARGYKPPQKTDIQNRSDGAFLGTKFAELLAKRLPFRALARVRVEGPATLLDMLLDGSSVHL